MGTKHECQESPEWLPEHSFILESSQQPREQAGWLVQDDSYLQQNITISPIRPQNSRPEISLKFKYKRSGRFLPSTKYNYFSNSFTKFEA